MMCIAQPGRMVEIVDREQGVGRVDVLGHQRLVNLVLLGDAQIGEWVLVELGFAVARIAEAEALERVRMLEEMAASAEDEEGAKP
jgi:hydrogenase expression/formation protein HypC